MVMAYKTPVERLKKRLTDGSVPHRSLRRTPTKKIHYSSMMVDTIPLWHTQLETYTGSRGSPLEISLCDWHSVGLVADFAHAVQWVRENAENYELDSQLDFSGLFACMHACMCLHMHVHACVHAHSTVFCFMLVSPLLLVQASPLSLSEGLRKALEEAVKLELGLPYLFAEKRPMRLASGWRGTLWHVSFPYLHGTFPQNSSIFTVDNLVKTMSAELLIQWLVISVRPGLHTERKCWINEALLLMS